MVDAVQNDVGSHLYLTVADEDENSVLELVKSDETGMFVRDDEDWLPLNPEDDNPRVWDRIIIDVTPEAVPEFDKLEAEGEVTADKLSQYEVPEGDTQ